MLLTANFHLKIKAGAPFLPQQAEKTVYPLSPSLTCMKDVFKYFFFLCYIFLRQNSPHSLSLSFLMPEPPHPLAPHNRHSPIALLGLQSSKTLMLASRTPLPGLHSGLSSHLKPLHFSPAFISYKAEPRFNKSVLD